MCVAHGALWQRSDTGAQPLALDWEPGNPQNTGEPAAQLQTSVLLGEHVPEVARQKVMQQGNLAQGIPKPGRERRCPADADAGLPAEEPGRGEAGAASGGSSGGNISTAGLGCWGLALALLVTGCKRSAGKGKGEKEDRADPPLKAVKQKSTKL